MHASQPPAPEGWWRRRFSIALTRRAAYRDGGGGALRRAGRGLRLAPVRSSSSPMRPGFYFIEMNTRLQVEHPVTEDDYRPRPGRVAVAASPWGGKAAVATGRYRCQRPTRIEARIYAEDPDKGFSARRAEPFERCGRPSGDGISGRYRLFPAGDVVTPYYDPLLAKLIAAGADRPQAAEPSRRRPWIRSRLPGVTTNLAFPQETAAPSASRERRDRHPGLHRAGNFPRFTRSASPSLAPARCPAAACVCGVAGREQRRACGGSDLAVGSHGRLDAYLAAAVGALSFRQGAERYDAVLWYARDGLRLEFGGRTERLQFVPRQGAVFRYVPRRRARSGSRSLGPAVSSI